MIWTGFLIGFLGSWHCIGMCGPLAMMVPGSKGKNRLVAMGLYFYGKTLAYLSIATLFGLIPALIDSFYVQTCITISAGILMLLLALLPSLSNRFEKGGFSVFNKFFNFKRRLTQALSKDKTSYGFYIGFLNGFMPCGLVYIAALGAMSQTSFADSILFMLLFSVGTMPLMSGLLIAAGYFKPMFQKYSSTIRAVGFILVGVFMIRQGVIHWQHHVEKPKIGEDFVGCTVDH